VELSLWDTAGQEEFDRLRALSYADTHVILLCFAVDSPVSLENAGTRWVAEITEHCPGVKIVLIGEPTYDDADVALKCDLREDPDVKMRLSKRNMRPVQYEEGLELARTIRATRYLGMLVHGSLLMVECSAKHNRGVKEAIYEAARVATDSRPKGSSSRLRSKCIIL
jgi:Rho family protein